MRPQRSLTACGHLRWGAIPQRAVRPTFVVFVPPGVDDHAGFRQCAKDFAVKALVAQLVVERSDVPVLPWRVGLDVERLDLPGCHPVLDGISHKLGAIVTADVLGRALLTHDLLQHREHIWCTNRPRHMGGKALPCVLVDKRQDAERSA